MKKTLTPVEVKMFDAKYASPAQLMDLAIKKQYDDMLYLLQNYTYCRYAISTHYRSLVSNYMPAVVRDILFDYHESAKATI